MLCCMLLTACICRFSQGLSARRKLHISGHVPDTVRGSSVDIVTGYGLDGPEIESWWG
jgi:hypothetical protein